MADRAEERDDHGFEGILRGWDGSAVVIRHDRPSDAWVFVALHDSALGPPTGGCRLHVYERPADGLRDALRLARGMTYKWAAIEFGFGGGKSVIAVPEIPRGPEREALLRRYGRLLEELRGAYQSGEDLGTTPTDMAVVAGETVHVLGVVDGTPVDPGPYTARGVVASIRAGLHHLSGSGSLEGRSVLVQGVGDVGAPLARMVAREGGRPVLTDPDEDRLTGLARELGAPTVPPEAAYDEAVDVFAPCAVGAVLNARTVPRLHCGMVAGSANNQLETDEDADRLHRRGILYVPDFVANAGGAIAFGMLREGADEQAVQRRVEEIRVTVQDVLEDAAEGGESPLPVARRRAERTLERARRARG